MILFVSRPFIARHLLAVIGGTLLELPLSRLAYDCLHGLPFIASDLGFLEYSLQKD
jgi:hypothetical protein